MAWYAFIWPAVFLVGSVVFYGRFYIQWIVSEVRKRSVVPVVFWYMSSAGSLLLLCYAAFYRGSAIGALSHCFNVVIYARNLVHVWNRKGTLSRKRYWLVHLGAGAVVCFSLSLLVLTWLGFMEKGSGRTWAWVALGVLGQGLFAARFIIQWVVTEIKKMSVIPVIFWYISVVAAVLLIVAHLNQPDCEWEFALGLIATLPVYLRNIWMLHRSHEKESATE